MLSLARIPLVVPRNMGVLHARAHFSEGAGTPFPNPIRPERPTSSGSLVGRISLAAVAAVGWGLATWLYFDDEERALRLYTARMENETWLLFLGGLATTRGMWLNLMRHEDDRKIIAQHIARNPASEYTQLVYNYIERGILPPDDETDFLKELIIELLADTADPAARATLPRWVTVNKRKNSKEFEALLVKLYKAKVMDKLLSAKELEESGTLPAIKSLIAEHFARTVVGQTDRLLKEAADRRL